MRRLYFTGIQLQGAGIQLQGTHRESRPAPLNYCGRVRVWDRKIILPSLGFRQVENMDRVTI